MTIIGEEDEVMDAAMRHGAEVHGHADTPEAREALRPLLEDESAFTPGEREKEPFPG